MQRQPKRFFLLVLLIQLAVCVFSYESKHSTRHFHLRHHNMSVSRSHDNTPKDLFEFSREVASMNLKDDSYLTASGSPRREFRLTADSCDCGVLTGCRCSDSLWDMVLERVDESDMEEGMMDQGYRQHV